MDAVTADPTPRLPAKSAPGLVARVPGILLALIAGSVLGVAAFALEADAAGLGTHTQLGLTPCGFVAATGLPCATCGMTTATTLAAHGHLLDSFRTQPAGFFFALTMAVCVIIGAWSAWTGRPLTPLLRPLGRGRVWALLVAVLLLAWGYRIADAFAGQLWTTL